MHPLRASLILTLLAAAASADLPYVVTTPGKASSLGVVPALSGSGAPTPGSWGNALHVDDAFPGGLGILVVGASELAIPFEGGILGPVPKLLPAVVSVDADGGASIPFAIPQTASVGVELWTQVWIAELAPELFLSATNTLKVTVLDPSLGDPLFASQLYPSGTASENGIVTELNGDGVPDLVVRGGSGTADVRVLAGVGNGAFCPPVSYEVGGGDHLAAGDLDADGDTDLLLDKASNLTILLGDGAGGFAPPVDYPVGTYLERPVLADLDADGMLDVVVPITLEDSVGVLLGAGNGTLGPVTKVPVGERPLGVAVGDLDGDGNLDLATANKFSKNLSIALGVGDGTFATPAIVPLTAYDYPEEILAADLNEDGPLDLLVRDENSFVLLAGIGDGSFGTPTPTGVTSVAPVALADLDGDGTLDVAGTSPGLTRVPSIQLGLGDGTFAPASKYAVGLSANSVSIGDLDVDGAPDLMVVTWYGVARLLGEGGGTFVGLEQHAVGESPLAIATGDFDGDGATDVLTANEDSGDLSLLRNAGDGSLEAVVAVPLAGAPFDPQPDDLAVGDLNGDGMDDIVVDRANPWGVSVLLAAGGGAFGAESTFATSSPPRTLLLADVSGDGVLDLVMAQGIALLSVRLGVGDGTFELPSTYGVDQTAESIAATDLDGDGIVDLAFGSPDGVVALRGTGGGAFGAPTLLPTPAQARYVAAGDLDADGDTDLVASRGAGSTGDEVWVLLGDGAGAFAVPVVYPVAITPQALIAADFTGDGALDVAVHADPGVWLLRGKGDGTLAAPTAFGAHQASSPTYNVIGMASGDLDGDGWPEIVAVAEHKDLVHVLRNQR